MKQQGNHVHDVLIIGAGLAGLGSAIRLQQAGISDIVILERDSEVGGTWRDNQYPGAACDIPSNLYSFSFVPNPGWPRSFSGSRDILAYIHDMVDRFDLAPLIHFNKNVSAATFDAESGVWTISLQKGKRYLARSVVMAQGPLSNASLPDITGIKSFKGKKIHSARWDHDYDFEGKRVAVIGTGASAVQIIPELVRRAGSVKVFQRTPGWVLPRPDLRIPEWNKTLFEKAPATQSAVRQALYWGHESMATALIWNTPVTRLAEAVAKRHLRSQVKDRWLRRQLTPDYRIGCKRVLMSSDYYPALQADNCQLITWPIDRISATGIRTAEGLEHQADCIVFATGFDVNSTGAPFPVTGLDDRQLADEWKRGAQAYKSVSVSGYPNLFLTFGPNSGPGHNSALVYMEAQIDYIVQGVKKLLTNNLRILDVKADVQAKHNQRIQKRLARTNWNSGCNSWYLTDDGFNATMYPGFATQYKRQMRTLREKDYQLEPALRKA